MIDDESLIIEWIECLGIEEEKGVMTAQLQTRNTWDYFMIKFKNMGINHFDAVNKTAKIKRLAYEHVKQNS